MPKKSASITVYKICASSKCWKRGGRELHKHLKVLATAGAPIQVEKCSCLGRCKKGPNLKAKRKGKCARKLSGADAMSVLEG